MATHFRILAWNSHGQRRLAGYTLQSMDHKEPDMAQQLNRTEQNRIQQWDIWVCIFLYWNVF